MIPAPVHEAAHIRAVHRRMTVRLLAFLVGIGAPGIGLVAALAAFVYGSPVVAALITAGCAIALAVAAGVFRWAAART